MSELNMQRRSLQEWQAYQLRATMFTIPKASPVDPSGWWQQVTEEERDRVEDKPKIAQHVEEGRCFGGVLSLTTVANRIDWTLSPSIDVEKGLQELPSVGSYISVRDDFLAAISRWLPSAPPVQRLAFGALLMLPVSSKDESYRLLGAYLPFSPDPMTSSDLRYQINRPRESRVLTDLKVNRLQAWASARFRIQAGISGNVGEMVLQEQYAVSLESDINTEAAFMGVLPAERLSDLLSELSDYATELAAEGDRQ
ncbi:MAG: hypothetical protein ACLP7Q_05410 [Isosphaeraceae bacterium]